MHHSPAYRQVAKRDIVTNTDRRDGCILSFSVAVFIAIEREKSAPVGYFPLVSGLYERDSRVPRRRSGRSPHDRESVPITLTSAKVCHRPAATVGLKHLTLFELSQACLSCPTVSIIHPSDTCPASCHRCGKATAHQAVV